MYEIVKTTEKMLKTKKMLKNNKDVKQRIYCEGLHNLDQALALGLFEITKILVQLFSKMLSWSCKS